MNKSTMPLFICSWITTILIVLKITNTLPIDYRVVFGIFLMYPIWIVLVLIYSMVSLLFSAMFHIEEE